MMNSSLRKTSYAALVCSIAVFATSPVQAYESPLHVFSINDVQGDFHGTTYAEDPSIICGVPHVDAEGVITDPYPCEFPAPLPIFDKEGIKLYPVDSEFGFYVVDFLGARQKIREPDNPAYIADYREGWVGNIEYQGQVVGVKVSNAETDKYKVKPPLGTWCQGLGGTSIKCSTEHYVAMEHVLSCHEIIPYMLANPLTGIQAELNFPPPYLDKFDCTKAELDDALRIIREGEITDDLLTSVEPGSDIPANDNTTVMDDIAVSTDYSVTLKDDGKPLYRWGAMIKRPNDIRLYAKLQLPQAWKAKEETEEGSGIWVYPKYKVTQAHLIVNHWVTNNPNDQLRPEDLENEAATGRKPDYEIVDGSWKSTRDCYEGDGDFLDTSEMDPTYLPAGTFLKNATYAGNPAGLNPPQVFSSDQVNGFTNAYYTSTNRDPFEWSYRLPGTPDNVYNFVGFPFPLTADEVFLSGLEPVSGPRWRLKSNKFGQNICGLEIPAQECSPPPFQHDNIKYEVGEMVTTVINLLDWEDKTESPLAFSDGWVDVEKNWKVEYDPDLGVTSNGLPMTDDFDLAVYFKGDRKASAIYNAKLELSYENEVPEIPDEWDVAITDLTYQDTITTLDPIQVSATITNYGPAPSLVNVSLSCVDNREDVWVVSQPQIAMGNDQEALFVFFIQQNESAERPTTLDCTLLADAEGDVNLMNNVVDFKIKVKKPK